MYTYCIKMSQFTKNYQKDTYNNKNLIENFYRK